jgi:beta-glucosidase/6-phospho-beta-glucosidase/beta-galactosidase
VIPLLLACTDEPAAPATGFPDDFLWGTSIAGFQVDPGCPTLPAEDCEDRASDWYQWVTDEELVAEAGTFLSGDPLSDGPGHWELFEEDIALAAGLGTGALRTSIEWSRLFPDGAAEAATSVEELAAHADSEAVAWYEAYFAAIRAAGLEPMVTLNHYTLPLWLHDGKSCHQDIDTCTERGWLDRDRMVAAAELYAGFCGQQFGGAVDVWATENEPLAIVLAGYLLPTADRTNPPGVADADLAVEVLYNLADGHVAFYDGVKAGDTEDADGDGASSSVGVVDAVVDVAPADPDVPLDVTGAEHADYVYNRAFLNAALRGEYDRDLDGTAEEVDESRAGHVDWLGVNYYAVLEAKGLTTSLFGDYAWMDFYPTVNYDRPDGMVGALMVAADYGLPIYVTENGTTPEDDSGETYLRPALQGVLDARAKGADVRGYFWWTLVDNYEWNHGMQMRFGLYELDVDTKARTARPIAGDYAEIVRGNGIQQR